MNVKISNEDIQDVCNDLKIDSTPEIIDYVMENYDSAVSNNPDDNFYLIIEDLIYGYINTLE